MKAHLVSGGCGFVGRNMVKRLAKDPQNFVVFIDDLSVGTAPSTWLNEPLLEKVGNVERYGEQKNLVFIHEDFRESLRLLNKNNGSFAKKYALPTEIFDGIFHFAAIVGGRSKIDGDPMMVALDLSIDAEFFYWICRTKQGKVLYPSSSAAYPVNLQTENNTLQLKESDIDFNNMGAPDMTYGWSKLTGEYLAKIAAQHYGAHITCIRPFSGYGEDQDLSYPIPAIAKRAAGKENPFEVWGSGKQGRDFVHIDDVLDCSLLAMEHISDGSAINIGMGKLSSFLEIIEIFTDFAGYKPTIKPLLDKPVGVHSRFCDMTNVKETLGWEAKISLREGLRRVYEAQLKNI
ncbi:MAG: NAD-dependent epimerase/dehydratase family protein [Luteibaculaceae bacterium]